MLLWDRGEGVFRSSAGSRQVGGLPPKQFPATEAKHVAPSQCAYRKKERLAGIKNKKGSLDVA